MSWSPAIESGSESGGVLAGREELGPGEREAAFAGALGGKAEAVADFELGLEEVGLQPVDDFDAHLAAEHGFGGWAGDALTSGQGCLVLSTDLG